MFPALLSLIALLSPANAQAPATQPAPNVRSDESPAGPPAVWIGLRLTPVPAPLAAHVGERGVMIANIAKGSPADKAGLERYDVVVGCAGREVNRPQDLIDAVGRATAGQPVKLRIIRKGAEREQEVTPIARPPDGDWEMKYAEPEESVLDDSVQMRGLKLKRGPDGRWELEELGRLREWPEGLKDYLKLVPEGEELWLPPDIGPDIHKWLPQELEENVVVTPGADEHTQVEVRVQTEEDGTRTSVQRGADGKIHVTRTDRDGKETSATYDDLKALEAGDAAAYKLLRQAWRPTPHFIHTRPSADRLRELQREYQVDIEKKLKDFRERLRERQEQAREKLEAPKAPARQTPQEQAEILVVSVDPQGGIKVVVPRDGGKITYEFKSRGEFQAAEPELYGKVKDFLP